ncbi:TauD/TfdA family dioxygenase [Crossiella sp. CA-258035]|uniref:TauD/TfdA family dioxygenase n=1 Tax=Crossiella sp. CA-258035 TaxID=2981138 RepID=UPI0024BD1B7C|nr:TauD/TfdA family dioxygenase [Crossiella sp. CA-258035]WHT22387.1 TauD/TfdA family dioxygenase [Crossiella sp. CA-258035]
MSMVLEVDAPTGVLTLNRANALAVEEVATTLLSIEDGHIDERGWVKAAGERAHELPISLRRALSAYRRDSGPSGAMVIRGLPVDESLVPETPTRSGSVQRTATVPAATLMMVTHLLGDVIAFRPEKSGALVHNVVPVPGSEDFQGNEGSVLLSFHNENAFHDNRPDHVLLLCLRADHDREAGLRTASIRQVHDLLSDQSREVLFRREFVTAPPPSFGLPAGETEPHAVLTGAPDDPDVLVDFAAISPLTEAARTAMAELQNLFAANALTHYLVPGDLAIVDNRVTVHGRTGFTPRYDGQDRWLQRTFATQDLRRSRAHRIGDGHVLYG